MYNKRVEDKPLACAIQPQLLQADVSRSVSFYSFGNVQRGKRHVQTVEGKILCGTDSLLYDGGVDRYSYDGSVCIWHYEERTNNYFPMSVPIEQVISCKKCQAALLKLVKHCG